MAPGDSHSLTIPAERQFQILYMAVLTQTVLSALTTDFERILHKQVNNIFGTNINWFQKLSADDDFYI